MTGDDSARGDNIRISPLSRLRELDDIFQIADLREQGVPYNQATMMLARWHRYGLTEPVGPKTGLHYNLFRIGPRADDGERPVEKAIAQLYDQAVVIGETALHRHDVSDNCPSTMTVAVPQKANRSVRRLHHVNVVGRPPSWFEAVADNARVIDKLNERIPTLDAPYAYADMVRYGGGDEEVEDVSQLEVELRVYDEKVETTLQRFDDAMRRLKVDDNVRAERLRCLAAEGFYDTREAGMHPA